MNLLPLAILIGIVAGLRSMTAPTAIGWAAFLGWLPLQGTPLAFLGYAATPYLLTVLALGELVADKLPSTPSRRAPLQFGARLVSGAVCGAAIGAASGMLIGGLVAGAVGALIGTLGGAQARARLARGFGNDLSAALLEDSVAVVLAVLVAALL